MKYLRVLFLVTLSSQSLAFAPFLPISVESASRQHYHHATTITHLAAKRNKLSAKEKRKRRAKQLQPRPLSGKPVNFDKPTVDIDEKQAEATADAPPSERAQQLVEAQRKSVSMLTHVRERVEALDYEEIQSSLDEKGYAVIDSFLEKDDIIDELQQEGLALFENDKMEVDLTNLGSGEYVCKIEGGEEQYTTCPRSVEFVVSMTKHMAPLFSGDPSACMATMRTYDKKAQQASLELLSGEPSKRPLQIVATEEKDQRKISVLYYPTKGGGVTFDDETTIPAERDRLFILKSDSCLHRQEPWSGEDGEKASCIELHLIQG